MTDDIKTAHVLIVDGDFNHFRLLERIVNDAGYFNLSTSMDPSLAVAMFNDDMPDIMLFDLIPAQDGYSTLRTLRSLVPPDEFLPIIVLTDDLSPQSRQRALNEGATDFLFKPVDDIQAALRLHQLLSMRALHRQLQNEKVLLEKRVRERTRALERMIAELRCATLPIFSENL